jgi:hypothetical protein
MKQLFAIAALLCLSSFSAFAADEPNEKVLAAFTKTFEGVTDVAWTDRQDTYEASFKHFDMTCRVLYDEEGNVLKTMRYYSGDKLPIFIQSKVAKKYSDKRIFGVTELTTADGVIYQIVLENDKEFWHVFSNSTGDMQVDQKYKKG